MKGTAITFERLRELVDYDPITGVFTRRTTRGRWKAGSIAGCAQLGDYTKLHLDYVFYGAHRLAVLWMTGTSPSVLVDHKNGIRSDNRWTNLRCATHQTNLENRHGPQSNNTSGALGVRRNRNGKRFIALLCVDGQSRHLGTFDTTSAAHAAYVAAKRVHHKGCTL